MKYAVRRKAVEKLRESRPARGAWVEMICSRVPDSGTPSSRPARGAWVEIPSVLPPATTRSSRPARGAWVEIIVD